MISLRKNQVFHLIFFVHIFGLIIYYNSGSLRDIAYALPLGALFFYLVALIMNQRLTIQSGFHTFLWRKYFIGYALLFYIILTQSILAYTVEGDINSRLIREAVFLIFPFLSVIVISYFLASERLDQYIKWLFLGVIVAFFLEKGVSNIFSLNFDLVESLIYSRFSGESGLAFLIGLFAFYFLFRKQKLFFLLSLFFMVTSGKRTVLAAFIPCVALFYFLKILRIDVNRYKLPIALAALAVNGLFIYFIHMLVSGEFDEFILTNTGLPPNSFTKGRYNLWVLINNRFGLNFLGSGLGSISDFLVGDLNYPLHNPLNDVLKVCVEHGFLVFALWFMTFYYVNSRTNAGFVIAVYSNVLFLTTNVLIYFFFMFCFYFIQISFLEKLYRLEKINDQNKLMPEKHATV
jgi:hypothetical protein